MTQLSSADRPGRRFSPAPPPAPPGSIPTNDGQDEPEHTAAWGFADTAFSADAAGVVRLSGGRYELCGLELRDFLPFSEEVLGCTIDPLDVYLPAPPPPLPPNRCPPALRERLHTLFADDEIREDDPTRRRHAHGHTQEEVFLLRYGRLGRAPDMVVFPGSEDQVVALVAAAVEHGACLIPYGGGTNVTEALRCPDDEPRPIISVDMRRMSRILWIDEESQSACIEAGAVGRHLNAALRRRGYTLGHEPDSVEFSTLGGWIATRASGMKKNRYGNIEDIVLDVQAVTPAGTLGGRPANPRESIGFDGRRLLLGSEGSLGIVTSAVVKIARLPEAERYGCYLFRDLGAGIAFLRELSRTRPLPASVRLVDNMQFRFGQALKARSSGWRGLKSRFERWFVTRWKGFAADELTACTLVFEGSAREVDSEERTVSRIAARHGGLPVGAENGKKGYQLTFGIAYIRDFIMQHYVLGESFETSVPWGSINRVCDQVRRRVESEYRGHGLPGNPFLSARITQIYDTGVCLYFYLAYRYKGVEAPARVYAALEHAAREEVLACGGSLSHHHGVGKIRQGFLRQVQPPLAISCAHATKQALDPNNVFGARNNVFGLPGDEAKAAG